MENISKVTVLGGGEKTGRYLVNKLVEKGFSVQVLLRNPNAFTIQNSRIEIIKGDAAEEESMCLLLKDCQAVLSTIGQLPGEPMVGSHGTNNILKAMEKYGIKRYIVLGGLNIDIPFDKKVQKHKWLPNRLKPIFRKFRKIGN